jgi:hypothetical protein
MPSPRAKRILLVIGLLIAVLLVGALVGAYMISRDPGYAFEKANPVEAGEFAKKFRTFNKGLANGDHGFVRFSQPEINSYIQHSMTNLISETNSAAMRLRRVGIGLGQTNLTLYTWGEYRFLHMPLKFVLQRTFNIEQNGTNEWQMPLEAFKIGELEVPKPCWDSMNAWMAPLDEPVKERFAWRTNIQALLVTKNELSDRPELRLYTYKPIPPEDLK